MSKKYKFTDNDKIYFVTFTVTGWIDLFIREEYREILLESIKYCQKNKGLELYGWCIMTSHLHLIVGTSGNPLSNIMRDLKRHTSEKLHQAIEKHPSESRREWLLTAMEQAGQKVNTTSKFQLWQPESHPVILINNEIAHQKWEYIHYNPVGAGFVIKPEDWKYSSAIDYYGGKGLLEIIDLPTLTRWLNDTDTPTPLYLCCISAPVGGRNEKTKAASRSLFTQILSQTFYFTI